MAATSRKNPLFTNPFFTTLVVVSIFFVVTILAWLVAAGELKDSEGPAAGPGGLAFSAWLDRHGPLIMGIEFTVMLVTGVLAMLTDDWFSAAPKPVAGVGLRDEHKPESTREGVPRPPTIE